MIAHLFNGNVPHGPERLVLPALAMLKKNAMVICLSERRLGATCETAAYARSLGITSLVVEVGRRWDRRALKDLERIFRMLKPRVVHAHDVKASTYLAALPSSRAGSFATISTHHGVLGRPGLRAKAYERFYSRFVLPRFDMALCVSQADRKLLAARGLPPSRLLLHRNGVDRARVDPKTRARLARAIRRRWGLEDIGNAKLVGVVGRLSSEKRHDLCLRAVARLAQNGSVPSFRLLCFGAGPRQLELQTLARKLRISDRVHWMGYRPEIGQEMAGLDVLLCLSDNEGIPITLLEAGWSATPVVASRVGGIPELVSHPGEGALVRPHDEVAAARALEMLLVDDARREAMGAALQARVVKNFTARHWLLRLQEIYAPWAALKIPNEGGVK